MSFFLHFNVIVVFFLCHDWIRFKTDFFRKIRQCEFIIGDNINGWPLVNTKCFFRWIQCFETKYDSSLNIWTRQHKKPSELKNNNSKIREMIEYPLHNLFIVLFSCRRNFLAEYSWVGGIFHLFEWAVVCVSAHIYMAIDYIHLRLISTSTSTSRYKNKIQKKNQLTVISQVYWILIEFRMSLTHVNIQIAS